MKEDLRIRKTKATLYKSYLDLIATKEQNQIKISDLCKKAHINRSTFYDHFKDKEELVNSLLRDTKNDLIKELSEIPQTSFNEYILEIIKKLKENINDNEIIKKLQNSNPTLVHKMISNTLKNVIKKAIQKDQNIKISANAYALFYSEGLTALLLNQEENSLELDGFKSLLPMKK